jgi:hypothetical protein
VLGAFLFYDGMNETVCTIGMTCFSLYLLFADFSPVFLNVAGELANTPRVCI